MARLTRDEVSHVARLAKLDLSEAEINKFLPQLTKVVDFVSQLNEVDTKQVEPTSQTTGLENVFRSDKLQGETLTQDETLSGTELTQKGYFVVKQVINKK